MPYASELYLRPSTTKVEGLFVTAETLGSLHEIKCIVAFRYHFPNWRLVMRAGLGILVVFFGVTCFAQSQKPGHIFVVRHAEKVSESADALSPMGRSRRDGSRRRRTRCIAG